MSGSECLPIRAELYIPENKRSAFVHKKGASIKKDRNREYQGVWVVEGYTPDKKKDTTEIWFFADDDEWGIDRRVLENNPLQGRWGYAPHTDPKKAKRDIGIDPNDMWFFPPESARCKIPDSMQEYIHRGTWVKPTFKRDFSQLGSNKNGFVTISGNMRIAKGEKHSITGKWNMMGFNDDIVRGRKREPANESQAKGAYQIYVRKLNGVRFPINVIPGNKILQCKKKIYQKKGIPIDEQLLTFNETPLHDEKTVIGSGIRNGDTIDLNPIIIYVRNVKGKKFTFEVDPDELVEDVKRMVQMREGTPVKKQNLHFKDWKLVDGKPISHFKIRHKSTLDLRGMIIYVQPVGDAPKINLEVEPTDSLESVKLKVKSHVNVPIAEQRLFFNEKEMLEDAATLVSYQVVHLDTLFLRDDGSQDVTVAQDPGMIVFIMKDWDKYKFQLTVEPTNTILHVKEMIEANEGIPIDKQMLTFKGKSVFNLKTLKQSKVKNRSTLHLEASKLENTSREGISAAQKSKSAKNLGATKKTPKGYTTPLIVTIETPSGNLPVQIDPASDTVRDIKKKVGKELGIMPKDFKLQTVGEKGSKSLKNTDKPNPGDILSMVLPQSVVSPHVLQVQMQTDCESDPCIFKIPPGALPMQIDPANDTVNDIKKKVGKELGIIPKDFKPQTVGEKGSKSLKKTEKSNPCDILSMVLPQSVVSTQVLQIQMQTESGPRIFNIDLEPKDTVDDVKTKVAQLSSLPLKDLHLLDNKNIVGSSDVPHKFDILDIAPLLDVAVPSGEKVQVPVLPTMTVGDVKNVIEEKTGVPYSKQRVFFVDNQNEELSNTVPMTMFDIIPGKVMTLKYPEIQVRDPSGRTFVLGVDPDDNPSTTKSKIAALLGVPTIDLHLILDGKEVSDDYVPSHNQVLDFAPEIEVQLPDQSKVKLVLYPTMDSADVKSIIEEKTGTPMNNQRIFFFDGNGNMLPDDVPLSKFGVGQNSILQMLFPEEEIIVDTPDKRSFVLMMDPSKDSAEDITKKPIKMLDVPIKDLNLTSDEDELETQYRHSKGHVLDMASEIEFSLPDKNEKTVLVVLPTMTIYEIKDVIEQETGIPKAHQRLFFQDNENEELDNTTSAAEAGIGPGKAMTMKPFDDFKIDIRLPDGRSFFLVIDPTNESCSTVRRKIAAKLGIPVKKLPAVLFGEDIITSDYRPSKGDVLSIDAPIVHVELPDKRKVQLAVMPAKSIGGVTEHVVEGKLETGRTFTLIVDACEPLKNVREKIRKKIGFPIGDLRIDRKTWGENDEDVTFEEAGGTRAGCVLAVEPPEIEIALPDNQKINLKIMPTMTMKDVKELIAETSPDFSKEVKEGRMFFFHGDSEIDENTSFDKIEFTSGQKLELRCIELTIKCWDGRTFKIGAQANWYIDDLKNCIFNKSKILPEKQRLSFEGTPVVEDQQLLKQGIVHNTTIHLEKMLIKVQIPSRKEPIFLDVEDTDLVTDIKRRALKKSDTLIEDPFIVFGGIPLVSERSLSQCSIQHNDLLLLEEYRISVLHWDGEVFLLDRIRQRDTVAKVQQILLEAHDIPLEEQQLSFSGKRLQSSRTLMEEGVNHRAVLVLEPRNINIQLPNADKKVLKKLKTKTFTSEHEEIWPIMPDWKHRIFFFDGDDKIDASIELSVLHWSGERVLLQEILLTMKISEVKDKILKLHGIKKKKQKLSFQGKLLDDNRTLLDQGVKHKSVLTLESLKKNTIANPNLDRVLLNPLPAKLESHISISVMHWKGDSIQLHADPHEYIDDIKEKIADQLSIPVDYQRLIFHGSSTSDHLNLKEQNIVNGAVLELLQMEILVEVATRNSPISVLVEPDDKISRVKRNLAKKANIPVDMQCILLAGEELTDSRTLSSYNIEHGDTLVLEMFKVRILHWSGDQFDLDGLNPTATVQEVKAAIWKLSKVPILDQQLVLKGKTLNDVLGLREQGVAYRSVLILQEKKLIDSEKNENMKSKVSFRFLKTAGAIDPLLTPFPLEVKLWDDTSFFIDVSGSDYIDDVKDKIFAIEKIPLDYQLLHHKGQPVTIDSNLQNQGIKKGSCLCLTYVPVSIKLPSGQTVDLQLSYRDTIKRAKQLLKETSGILAKDQFLMMSGKELNDSMRVCDYGIDGDDILLLETFTIKVADWVGKLFEVIGLHPGNGLQDLNAKITDMKGIPAERQILKFNGRSMNSAASLKDQGIEHRSILVLEPPDDRIMSPTKEKLSFKFFSSALGPSKESYKVAQTPILCLHIKNSNGDMFLIKAQPTEYVEDIKEKICIKKKIPVNKQRLKFEGALLENTSTLQSLGICDGSVLFLGMIQIQVKLPNGTCIDVEVEVDDTVVRLKRRLKDLGGVSVENQFLMFGGQLLENTKKLSLYGIDHEDIIELEMFKVYIADWTGDVFEVSGIQPSNNISAVKDQIKAIRGIVPSQQILSANGQKLNEFLRLKDQGLKHRTILFLDSPSRMQSIIEVDNGKNQDEEREEITTATNSSLTSESKMNGKGGKMTRGENANGINRGKMKSKPLDEPSHTSKTKKLKRKKEIKESNK